MNRWMCVSLRYDWRQRDNYAIEFVLIEHRGFWESSQKEQASVTERKGDVAAVGEWTQEKCTKGKLSCQIIVLVY